MADDALARLEQTASVGPIAHLPLWEAYTPDQVEVGAARLIEEVDAAFATLEGEVSPTWAGTMEPLEHLEHRLGHVVGVVSHLVSVKYTDELKAAFDAIRPDYVALANRMSQSRPIYDAMLQIRAADGFADESPARRRVVEESIRAMERSGVHLEGGAKARYREIQQRLAELSNDFSSNLVKQEQSARIDVEDPDRVAGVPEPILALAATRAVGDGVENATAADGPWHFAVNGPNYVAVIQHGKDQGLREEFYRAYRSRGTASQLDNRPLLQEILELRQEMAQLVGFSNYAEFSVAAKMAPDVAAVWTLFEELESAARPAAEREYAQLVDFMRAQGAPEAEDPQPWDVGFWSERLRESLYDYDGERLRSYFQMPKVFDGLFSLVAKLYDVQIREVEPGSVPVWDESVRFFEVVDDSEVVAGFYVDPYARPGEKRGGAWMNTVVQRSRLLAGPGQSSSLPVALFVMNGRPPGEGAVGLMSLDEVRTLFHEFGHAMQHMFTQIEESGASGLNLVEWDAVELASQFNEFWMDHKPFLRGLTAHAETGEQLDLETIDRVVASRNFMVGNGTLRQLQFGKTDMTLHEQYGFGEGPDPFEIESEIVAQTVVTPSLADESMLPAFTHLFSGGYAAGYYSYKWAEVLAADEFAAFREVGLDNDAGVREVAQRFNDTVLGLGGSLPAVEVYRLFRGRDAEPAALLEDQGLR